MIILSQDRTWAVNLDKCTDIFVGEMGEITAAHGDRCITLGVYSSEEKAKKVLEVILVSYSLQVNAANAILPGNEKSAEACLNVIIEQYGDRLGELQTQMGLFRMPEDEEVKP